VPKFPGDENEIAGALAHLFKQSAEHIIDPDMDPDKIRPEEFKDKDTANIDVIPSIDEFAAMAIGVLNTAPLLEYAYAKDTQDAYNDIYGKLAGVDMQSSGQITSFYKSIMSKFTRPDNHSSIEELIAHILPLEIKSSNPRIFKPWTGSVKELQIIEAPDGGDQQFADPEVMEDHYRDQDMSTSPVVEGVDLSSVQSYLHHEEIEDTVSDEMKQLAAKAREKFGDVAVEEVGGAFKLNIAELFGEEFFDTVVGTGEVAKLSASSVLVSAEVDRKLAISSKYFKTINEEISPITNDRCQVCNERIDASFRQINALISTATRAHSDYKHPASNRILFVLKDIKDKYNRHIYESTDVRKAYDKDPSSTSWRPVCKTRIPIFGLLSLEGQMTPYNVSAFKDKVLTFLRSLGDESSPLEGRAAQIEQMSDVEAHAMMRDWSTKSGIEIGAGTFSNKKTKSSVDEAVMTYVQDILNDPGQFSIESFTPADKKTKPSRWESPSSPTDVGSGNIRLKTVNLVKDSPNNSFFSRLESTYIYYNPVRSSVQDFVRLFVSEEDVLAASASRSGSSGALEFLSEIGIHYSSDHQGCLNGDVAHVDPASMLNFKGMVYLHLAAVDPIISMGALADGMTRELADKVVESTCKDAKQIFAKHFGDQNAEIITKEFTRDVLKSKHSGNTFLYSAISKNASAISAKFANVIGESRRQGHVKDYSDAKYIFDIKKLLEDRVLDALRQDGEIDGNNEWSLGANPEISYYGEDKDATAYKSTDIFGSSSSEHSVVKAFRALRELEPLDFFSGTDNFKRVSSLLYRPARALSAQVGQMLPKLAETHPEVMQVTERIRELTNEKNRLQEEEVTNPSKTQKPKILEIAKTIGGLLAKRKSVILALAKDNSSTVSLEYAKKYKALTDRRDRLKAVIELIRDARNSMSQALVKQIQDKFKDKLK